MKKPLIILFVFFYWLGILLCPMGDFSSSQSLHAEYGQCRTEDPDIDVADFVFEHLLNLEVVLANFEHDEDGKNDKPHQPFRQAQSQSPTLSIVGKTIHFEPCRQAPYYITPVTYPIYKNRNIPSGYLTEVFHPPSVC